MSVLWVPRALFKGKSNETPFLFFYGWSSGFHTFFKCKDKIRLPFTFQLRYRGSSLRNCSTFQKYIQASPDCGFLSFQLFVLLRVNSRHVQTKPSCPQIPQSGMPLCVTLARDVSVLAREQQLPAQGAKPSRRGKAPLPVLPWPWYIFLLPERIRKYIPLG